jgi:acyl transferase domain-containing protein/thioesterase domain-containing protein/acyl carrier protein
MILPEMSGQEDSGRVPAIAVLGLSGRFPGARGPSAFWANLRAGRESVTDLVGPPLDAGAIERVSDGAQADAGGRLEDISGFDATFFGMSVPAASAVDPQHRLFLECAWEAFEHAGYIGERVGGPVSVFAASGPPTGDAASHRDVLAPLVSRKLNLTGPSMDVQTAGGSSLAAVHLACQSLLNGECDMALAGGSTLYSEQNHGRRWENASSESQARAVDAAAAVTVMASAVACVVLKRLDDAVQDGDQVLAVIRGSAINNTGARQAGDSTADLAAQVRVVGEALALAGVRADQVSYVEVNGTGTPGGDPIEILALTKAFGADTAEAQFCAVGTVKGNIGDAGEAAGIVGLIKVVLALQHREIPATLQVEKSHPAVHAGSSPFYVNTALRDWTVPAGRRRIAGITALGEGGTNLHLILEEAPEAPLTTPSRKHQLVVLSAATPTALETATENLSAHLGADTQTALADVAYTLLAGRQPLAHRRIVVARDTAEAARMLAAGDTRVITDACIDRLPPSVAWMFPGGGQYAGMGADLYTGERVYREALDEALSGLDRDLELAARRRVHPAPEGSSTAARMDQSPQALPALVAVEYAVGRLLQGWGLTPAGIIGDGAGEYAAACIAGVFDIRQAMALAALESRLLQTDTTEARGDEFERFCRTMPFQPPTIPLVSGETGGWITAVEATDSHFWGRRLQRRSRVSDGLRTLMARHGVFVEIGPCRTLAGLLGQQPNAPAVVTPTLRPADEDQSDVAFLLTAVGRLWAAGVPVDAQKFFAGERRRRVALPTYPFERQRCSNDPGPPSTLRPTAGLAKRPDLADWFALPAWSRSPRPPRVAVPPSSWLVLTDDSPLAADMVAELHDAGHHVTAVVAGAGFALVGPGRYTVRPSTRADYEALAEALRESGRRPRYVLHLWAMTPPAIGNDAVLRAEPNAHCRYRDGLARNYFSLVYLAQAIAADVTVLDIYCVSSQVQSVSHDDEVVPEKAVLLGPCKVFPREYPGVSCTSIDIDWPLNPSARSRLVDNLMREFGHQGTDGEIALRGRDRWIRRYDAVRLRSAVPQEWLRAGATYVITGDPGGIALSIADHLAANGPVRLAFIGQFGMANEPEAVAAVQRLRAHGTDVLTLVADVSDLAAMRRALSEVGERFGGIHGVFHAAGTLEQQIIALRDGSLETPVLDANFKTALVLDELFAEAALLPRAPELFVLFSSVSSILGLPGQVEYTAATIALDTLAQARSRRAPGRTVSINWSAWRDVGVLADLLRAQRSMGDRPDMPWHGARSRPAVAPPAAGNPRRYPEPPTEAALRLGITTAEGVESLDRILATDLDGPIIASAVPLEPWLERLRGNAGRPTERDDRAGVDRSGAIAPLPIAVDSIERDLAAMWCAVLELDDVDAGEDFFDLGGHSLSAVQLFRKVRDMFGVDLPLATLFEAPTIEKLAGLLRERMAGGRLPASAFRTGTDSAVGPVVRPVLRCLVAVQHGAGRTPLFVVHGAGGHVLNITDLARAMDPSQAVLGLQASGIDGVSELEATIEEMARTYLEEVRTVQPHGPYLLAGYSGGGVIAFEMARRLVAAGEAIGVLAFIDTFHPQMPLPQVNVFTRLERLRREGPSYVRDALDRRRRSIRDDRDWRRLEKHLAAGEPVPLALRELHMIRNFMKAARCYQPQPWPGKALLFRADQVDYYYRAGGPTYGWDKTILGGIEIIPVPGDHHSILLGANAARIARRLGQAIDEVTTRQNQDRRG